MKTNLCENLKVLRFTVIVGYLFVGGKENPLKESVKSEMIFFNLDMFVVNYSPFEDVRKDYNDNREDFLANFIIFSIASVLSTV